MPSSYKEQVPGTIAWVNAKLEAVNNSIRAVEKHSVDTKEIALKAHRKADEAQKTADTPHVCLKEDVLRSLREEVGSWSKWWRGTMITVISAIVLGITVMAGWLYSHRLQGEKIESLDKSMNEVKEEVQDLGESQKQIKNTLDRGQRQNTQKEEERLQQMKKIFTTVLEENGLKKQRRK